MRSAAIGLVAALVAGIGVAGVAAGEPRTLEECYLRAIEKATPDAVQLAREICDAVFRPTPRAVAVLDPKKKTCSEWWFDRHGRYESREHYCSLEPTGPGAWRLACQWKGTDEKSVTYVELREEGDRYARVGALRGVEIGELFQGLAGCVRHQLGPDPADG